MSEQLTFPGYVEAAVIVDGALEEEETFSHREGKELEAWLRTKKQTAMSDPRETQIYLTQHDHPVDVEDCSCTQYLTDHHPFWEWPPRKRSDL